MIIIAVSIETPIRPSLADRLQTALHMKSFDIEISDLEFLQEQIATPIVRIVRYESSTGNPIYGFTKPDDGAAVELGELGTFDLLDIDSSWQQFVSSNSIAGNNDTLFFGTNGRGLGDDGNDKLFIGAGGGNFLSGGAGADQFWIANAELPSGSNTIVDFQIGTDVIGIQGAKSLGISATSLKLTQVGADTTINFGSQTLAILTGIQASSLTPGNMSQFVFA